MDVTVGSNPNSSGRRFAMFEDDPAFWSTAALVLGVVSFCKGIRAPNRWAATQALVDYNQGFVKRGLFGATLSRWLHLERYARFSVVAYVLLFVFVALLVTLVARNGVVSRIGSGEPVALFFASFAFTFLANLVGYLDIPLGICALLLLLVRDVRLRFVLALPLCVVAILIHENFLLLFLPAVLFSFVADASARGGSGWQRQAAWMCGVLAVVSAGLVLRLAALRPLSPAKVAALQQSVAARADFPIRPDLFAVMTMSAVDNVVGMGVRARHMRSWDLVVLEGVMIFGPTFALILVAIRGALRSHAAWRSSRGIQAFALLAAGSPLLMFLLGWDSSRWLALACLEAFLVLIILSANLPPNALRVSPRYVRGTILCIALSMATGERLMDEQPVHQYPFWAAIGDTVDAVKHQGWRPGVK